MPFIKVSAVFVSILAFAVQPALAGDDASTILVNGHIITVDDQFSIRQAVALRGERIIATGTNDEIRALAEQGSKVIDLGGRTVIPGLIDNHNHLIRATEHWTNEARLDGVQTRKEALRIIQKKVESLPDGQWLFTLGGWYEDQFIGDQSGFTLEELDRLAPDNPAFIQAKYDHAYVNSAWLEAMDIDVDAAPGREAPFNVLSDFVIRDAAGGGWPVQTHAIQPETIDLLFDVMEEVDKTHPLRALRWSVTHADHIGAAQIERARALGVNLQLRGHPVNGGVGKVFEKYGDGAYHMPPLRLVQDSGISFGFGSDGTKASQLNPFITMWWATTGKMLSGEVINHQLLTREEALIAFTRSNAFMTFQENDLGAIKPGLLADMVVLDRDYLSIPLDEIKDIKPVATIVGGRVVYGKLPNQPRHR